MVMLLGFLGVRWITMKGDLTEETASPRLGAALTALSGQRESLFTQCEPVIDPRGVLEEFGLTLPRDKKIRVWDSTAELRYLVVPQRPAGTEGWSEERLANLVTRDSMIGTGLALEPEAA